MLCLVAVVFDGCHVTDTLGLQLLAGFFTGSLKKAGANKAESVCVLLCCSGMLIYQPFLPSAQPQLNLSFAGRLRL